MEAALGLLGLPRREGIDEPGVFTWREQYVDALVALGRLEEADGALAAYEALATGGAGNWRWPARPGFGAT